MPKDPDPTPYDALLLVSFGGPERPDDVLPFLENVTRGRGIPRERLEAVAEHYFALGGRSPINDQCRAFLAAVRADFATHGLDLPIYWGNRNWDPLLGDAMAAMTRDGVRRAAAFVTSAYASYSGCRQYRENLFDATAPLASPPRIDKLRHYFNHPGFVDACADASLSALSDLPAAERAAARLIFVTHSIPTAMAETAGPAGGAYQSQHRAVAQLVMERLRMETGRSHDWDLAYCSRSGSPSVPWLEPDVNDHLETLREAGTRAVVLVPIGFVSDHMEVVYDLDTEAADTAERLGLTMRRAATAGVHPSFVAVVRDLLLERAQVERGRERGPVAGGDVVRRRVAGDVGASWDVCASTCCPNPRGALPALCETPWGRAAS